MKTIPVFILAGSAALVLFAQQQRVPAPPGFEITSVFPREDSPGKYEQVEHSTLDNLSAQGWELVGVTPYVYRNEEHNNGEMHGPKPVVTQVYPAYFFKRARRAR